jgi:hypothetical protein
LTRRIVAICALVVAAPASVVAAPTLQPAERGDAVTIVGPGDPDEFLAWLPSIVSRLPGGCAGTDIGPTLVTATHCDWRPWGDYHTDRDVLWIGPRVAFVDPANIPIGAPVYALGYPNGDRTLFRLTNLGVMRIGIGGEVGRFDVLQTKGDDEVCAPGSSGAMGWANVGGRMVPIGPMSTGNTDPTWIDLEDGEFVCGFALGSQHPVTYTLP